MNTENQIKNQPNPQPEEITDELSPDWGTTAPKGGRTVLNRVLKDGAKVPLFLGQTLVQSLRDVGYNNTTTAICEHIDNAIQWGAKSVRIYFNQTGKPGKYKIDVLVQDDGVGMSPHVLKVATSFGGSMVYDNRGGIGRYGMGMKAAALSMCPVLDIYSWQEPKAIYNMTLDVNEVGSNRSNLVELADAEFSTELPSSITDILSKAMKYPKNPDDSQDILAEDRDELVEALGNSGTIVFMEDCDRLTYRTARGLVDHATKEIGRVYRKFIGDGLKIFVNNRQVKAFDPTYWMTSARHVQVEGITEKQSRLVKSWPIEVPLSETKNETATVTVRLYALPYEDWGQLQKNTIKKQLHVYENHRVSFMRNDREVEIGSYRKLHISGHHTNNWLRLQIDFDGQLDEAFGVAANKQGVRPKDYVFELIGKAIKDEVSALRKRLSTIKADREATDSESKISEAERKATEAEGRQGKRLDPNPLTEDEQIALDKNLETLAISVKRKDETNEQAFERVKASKYITVFMHDEYWPFYHCDFEFGKVILKINTAHAFFQKIWEPLRAFNKAVDASDASNGDNLELVIDKETAANCSETLVSIQLLLLSLARTQGQMSSSSDEDFNAQLFDRLRKEWSDNLQTQLTAE
jgi:hypothetical protein